MYISDKDSEEVENIFEKKVEELEFIGAPPEMKDSIINYIILIKKRVTMHKMQGSSIESSEMEIGSSIFEYGQVYVGLSRVKGMKGLYIVEIKREKIKTNEKVKEYYSKLGAPTPQPIK